MSTTVINKKLLLDGLTVIVGTAFVSLAFYLFLKPNNVMAPGLGGIVLILGHFVPINLGVLYFILNIPFFLLGYRYVGLKFVLFSFFGMLCLSGFLYIFESIPGIHFRFLGGIAGGILSGIALAAVLLAGGSTGGMDIACVVINRIWPNLTVGKVMFFINTAIVLASGFVFGFLQSLLTIVSIFLAGKALDLTYGFGLKRNQKNASDNMGGERA